MNGGYPNANIARATLVLLNLMLPNRNGLELCSVLRQGGRVPVIILFARSQKADKIQGLQLGADDYLTKPFDLQELLARIHAVLRRSRRVVERLALGNVTINPTTMKASAGSQELDCLSVDGAPSEVSD